MPAAVADVLPKAKVEAAVDGLAAAAAPPPALPNEKTAGAVDVVAAVAAVVVVD